MKMRRGNKSHTRMFFIQGGLNRLREEPSTGPLQGLGLDETAWMIDADCTDTDPEAFFSFESSTDRYMLQRICADCPVRQECRDYATKYDMHGFWGGTTRYERRRVSKEAS